MTTKLHSAHDRRDASSVQHSHAPGSIASVTVTFNAGPGLRAHLNQLRRQTHRLDEIIVVDNASTDNTRELLQSEFPEVTVLPLAKNVGIGGGLAAGLQYAAFQKKYDWIWTFDQDSIPPRDGLQRLLTGLDHRNGTAKNVAILAPVSAHSATGMPCHGLAWRGAHLSPVSMDASQPVMLLDSVVSSGSLVRREALEAAGLPRADFFMDFVDHEHCLRLRRYGFEIAMVRDCRLEHSLGEPAAFHLLGRRRYWANHEPWREYYMTRNEVFTIWKHYPRMSIKALTLYRLMRHAAGVLLFGNKKLASLAMMVRGFKDGRAGKLGITLAGSEPSI